jgi:hypothetical protein
MLTATVESRMHNPLLMFPDALTGIQAIHEPLRARRLPDTMLVAGVYLSQRRQV